MTKKNKKSKIVAGPNLRQVLTTLSLVLALSILPSRGPSQQEIEKHIRVFPQHALDQNVSRLLSRYASRLSEEEQKTLGSSILASASQYRLDPILILALIRVESDFQPLAISSEQAMGLMQLRPFVARALAKDLKMEFTRNSEIYEIQRNIHLGSAYLAHLMRVFDYDLLPALSAYNYGPTRIQMVLRTGQELPAGYARKVLSTYQEMTTISPYQVET